MCAAVSVQQELSTHSYSSACLVGQAATREVIGKIRVGHMSIFFSYEKESQKYALQQKSYKINSLLVRKLNWVAPMVTDRPEGNSTTRHNQLRLRLSTLLCLNL